MDFRNGFVRMCYTDVVSWPPDVFSRQSVIVNISASTNGTFGFFDPQERLKPGYIESLPEKLKQFSAFLGERKWFAGENVRLCVCAA